MVQLARRPISSAVKKLPFALTVLAAVAAVSLTACTDDEAEPVAPPPVTAPATTDAPLPPLDPDAEPSVSVSPSASPSTSVSVSPSVSVQPDEDTNDVPGDGGR